MSKGPIGFVFGWIALCCLCCGCSANESGRNTPRNRYPDRYVQRTVSDQQGRPFLKISCEYIGQQPYKGFESSAPWQTKDIDFYNFEFENLTRHKITFISKKVYRKDAGSSSIREDNSDLVLTESLYFMDQPDSDFDSLEPLEQRRLINLAFATDRKSSDTVATILLQIRYLNHEYTFNLHLTSNR